MKAKKNLQACVPEPLRFVRAFCSTLLLYLAIYGIGCWHKEGATVTDDTILCLQMFISSLPLAWYGIFLANDALFINELKKDKFVFCAYCVMLMITIVVNVDLLWLWVEAYLANNDFHIWEIFFFLIWICSYIVWVLLLIYLLVRFKLFPTIDMFGK